MMGHQCLARCGPRVAVAVLLWTALVVGVRPAAWGGEATVQGQPYGGGHPPVLTHCVPRIIRCALLSQAEDVVLAPPRNSDGPAVVLHPAPQSEPGLTRGKDGAAWVLRLSVYADKSWCAIHGAASREKLRAVVEEAATIYESQLNMTFEIVNLRVLEDRSFGSNDGEEKLEAFSSALTEGRLAGFGSSDVYHLFTGDWISWGIVGMSYQLNDAYRGTVCRAPEYSVGWTAYAQSTLMPFIFAHELGHSLSATHPEADRIAFPTAPPDSLMTGIVPLEPAPISARRFSEYSLAQIRVYLDFITSGGTGCLGGGPTDPPGLNVPFRRGDVNGDGGLNISDPIALLSFLFQGGAKVDCEKAADANDSGSLNITDSIYLLRHLFAEGKAPPAPFDGVGDDPTPDQLTCIRYPEGA